MAQDRRSHHFSHSHVYGLVALGSCRSDLWTLRIQRPCSRRRRDISRIASQDCVSSFPGYVVGDADVSIVGSRLIPRLEPCDCLEARGGLNLLGIGFMGLWGWVLCCFWGWCSWGVLPWKNCCAGMRTFACSPVALQQGSCVSNQPQWISSLQLRNLKPSSIGRFRGSPSQRICSSCGPHLCRKSVSLTQVGCKIDGSDSPSVTTFSNLRLTERRSQLQSQAGRQPASNDENDVVAEIVEKELDTDVVSDEWQWTKTNQELVICLESFLGLLWSGLCAPPSASWSQMVSVTQCSASNWCIWSQIAYTLLLVAVPIGTILPLSHLQWSGAFYFLFLAVWTVYVGSHRRYLFCNLWFSLIQPPL